LGIRLTAKENNIDITVLPFFKSAFSIECSGYSYRTIGQNLTDTLSNVDVVINRCQSKNRRLNASAIFESIGKSVINPQNIEYVCYSKLRTLLLFASKKIPIPKTVYVSPNILENIVNNGKIDNTNTIINLLESELSEPFVVKPDYGTHGLGVTLINDSDDLKTKLQLIHPTVANPTGLIAQELIKKWFFDLRIIVSKRKGRPAKCEPFALARGGFKDFRTNTFLGNMVFKAKLPSEVIENAVSCASVLSSGQEAWVIGLDAMPRVSQVVEEDSQELREKFEQLFAPFEKVSKIKKMPNRKQRFVEYTKALDEAFLDYMRTESYSHIQDTVNEVLSTGAEEVVFHEGNSCPEFWEQTRAVAGINIAELLLSSAQSLVDR
jgi:glutathione synthase/RimK-type ligase-like ATP-grasp enzyme